MTLLIGAVLGLLLTGAFLQLAKALGWGKAVRRDGPASHLSKAGTPTMGGVAFVVAAVLTWLLVSPNRAAELPTVLLLLGTAAFGLLDDILGLRRKRRAAAGEDASTGLLARYRLLGQALIALLFSYDVVRGGVGALGNDVLDVVFFALVIVGSINAFNFADGIDGLAAGITAIMLLLFLGEPLAAAMLGALLGFLWYNAHPARVFMGGVGSESLGALVAALAITRGEVWYLPLLAAVPVLEVLSVIAQVSYFRATGGRRLLRMSPLHHHFELSGWPETRVVLRFWLVTAVCVALTYALWQASP